MILTGVFLFIVPAFESVLTEMTGGGLPGLTKTFFGIARNIEPFWIAVGVIIAVILVLYAILSTSAAGRRIKESLLLKVPVIGNVYYSSVLGRMAEAMAVMVASGCDMPGALRLSSGATGSERLIAESETLASQIEQGANILEAGQLCRMIPRLFLYSIQLGTQRNELQDNLYSLGEMYAEQARCGQARLQAVLLPAMLIFVGGFVAMTVLAMFAPMVQVITSLSATA
jgi:type IV pilus assembly protein PilC